VRCGRESDWRIDKTVHILSKKSTHHPCTTAADQRHRGSYPEVLDQASFRLHKSRPWRVAPIDHKLHEFDEIGIGTVHDGDATGGDLTIVVRRPKRIS
jgi:hypothetical protein